MGTAVFFRKCWSGPALAHLCGPLEAKNLRQMEAILGVKIVRQGEQFQCRARSIFAQQTARALESLPDRVRVQARTHAE